MDGRILLGDNTGGEGGHAAADQIASFLSLDFIWTPFFLYICMIISDFHKIRIPPVHPERNY